MNIAHSHSGGVAGPIIAVPIVATPIASAAGVPPSLAASLGGVTQGSGILTSASLTPSVSASSGLVAPHSLAPPTGSVSSGGGVPVVSVAGGATVHGGVSHSAAHTGAGSTATHAQAPPLAAAPHLNIAQQQQQQPAAAAAAAGSSSSAANPSSSQTQCGECGRIITGKLQFRLHSEKHVRDRVKRERGAYKCPLCMRGFTSEKTLRQHVDMTHNKIGGCKCHVCGRVFGSEHNLRQHVATHANMGAFRCALCARTFSSDHNRRQHQATHSTNGPYNADEKAEGEMFPCKICERLFGNDFNRKQHELTHQRRSKKHGSSSQSQSQGQLIQGSVALASPIIAQPPASNESQLVVAAAAAPLPPSSSAATKPSSLVITSNQTTTSLQKCQYCNAFFQEQCDLLQHEDIHRKLGHIEAANLLASQNLLANQNSCKFAGGSERPESQENSSNGGRQQDMKPLICHQCGLLCPTEAAMIEHEKQHETLNKLYQNQQQQQQPQQRLASHSQATSSSQQQQQHHRSEMRTEQSPHDGGRSSSSNALASPAPQENDIRVSQTSSNSVSATVTSSQSQSNAAAVAAPPGNNLGMFPMPQISPGLPSMLDELCLAATTWNSFYTQQSSQQSQPQTAGNLATQLPKGGSLVAPQNHVGSNGNSMLFAAQQPGQHLALQQQMALPRKKKKKKKKKPKVNFDDIFECSICHQTFATEFHRNIHANSHKYYDGNRGGKSPGGAPTLSLATVASVAAAVENQAKSLAQQQEAIRISSTPGKSSSGNHTTASHSTTSVTNTINNVANSSSSSNNHGASHSNASPAGRASVSTPATTTCSYNNMETSGGYVASNYNMVTSAGSYGNAFPTVTLPAMVPMTAPGSSQYPGGPPTPIFPLLHRPGTGPVGGMGMGAAAALTHHPVTQQPLFPQPIPQPVFPQR